MDLFRSEKRQKITDIDPLICNTPFGDVIFQAGFNNKEMVFHPIRKSVTEDNAFILYWRFKECEVEFFRADFIPKIPVHMKIDYCTAGIWRVKSFSSALHLKFKTFIPQKLKKNETPDFETGEGLVSCLYENNKTRLSIGTEDEEYLALRARSQNWMPNRLEDTFLNTTTVEPISGGLQVIVPQIEMNEVMQIQFILAWTSQKYPNSSTWFAVDQNANFILSQFNVI